MCRSAAAAAPTMPGPGPHCGSRNSRAPSRPSSEADSESARFLTEAGLGSESLLTEAATHIIVTARAPPVLPLPGGAVLVPLSAVPVGGVRVPPGPPGRHGHGPHALAPTHTGTSTADVGSQLPVGR